MNHNNKHVLKDIYLSFFYGAKIGIIGLNGSGKSTLLKIIAGIEKSYQGDIHFKGEHTIGYLEQEPQLDPSRTVMDIVKEGAKAQVELLEEYNKINDLFLTLFVSFFSLSSNTLIIVFKSLINNGFFDF